MKAAFYLFISALFLTSIGCSNRNEEKDSDKELSKIQDSKTFYIKTIDAIQLKKIIDNRNGKLLFINIWATWCVPCVEEFPDVVKIAKDYKDKNLDFITLNIDLVSDIDSKVIPFLRKNNADLPVYIVEDKNSEDVIELLNKDWSGAIPVTIIYDKEGKQRSFMLGAQDYNYFRKSIDSISTL